MNQFNFDIGKITKAIDSGTVSFPRGLGKTRQQFLRDDNKHLGNNFHPKEYTAVECVRGLLYG